MDRYRNQAKIYKTGNRGGYHSFMISAINKYFIYTNRKNLSLIYLGLYYFYIQNIY